MQATAQSEMERALLQTAGSERVSWQREAAAAMEAWFWNVVKLTRKLEAEKTGNSRHTPDNVRTRTKLVA